MSVTVTSLQLNMMRHALDTFYGRSSAYATRLAGMDLDEKERNLLIEQHRKQVGGQAMRDIESTFGGWSITRDPTEAACP